MISLNVKINSVEQTLRRLQQATSHTAPLMRNIAGIMADAVEQNFAEEGRPAWLGLKPSSWLSRAGALTKRGQVSAARFERKVRGGKMLQDSGRLASSITPASDANSAQVGTNVKYAAIHQFGGQTSAHTIRPRNKKALAWATGRHPVKQVNHPGSKIPARPFLQLTAWDEGEIERAVEDYLRGVVGQ
ncbi:phage virion morphogenesis protein [Aquitalea pelogenes]|uniref:phage virion morphogenesis protein n=1 Tax=Aquitalea pelogenes TaxID=1293573 RepID=UPI000788FD73|nr:phage virion morphogenesis protein [Aquitalea pelogenes]